MQQKKWCFRKGWAYKCIYDTHDGRILQINNTTNNSNCSVKNIVELDHAGDGIGWGDDVLGIDSCLCWRVMPVAF